LQQSTYVPQEPIEAPQYALGPYTADRLRLSVTPGKTKKVTKRGRLFDGKGQGYKHTEYKSTKDLEFGKKEVTRLIPRIVQKITGYDPEYFEGSYDEEGNYIPGELDFGNEVGGRMEFRGAASLQDLINQQKYAKDWEEYERKIDEREEQSKKKQEEGRAFKKGGTKKRIYNPNAKYYADGGENLQEECPPYHYWNGETCVPVSRELAPLDPQYLSENPDVATNMQIEPEVSVSPLGSDFSKAKSWIDKWHDSPMHDKMLMKSLQGNKKLFKEYKDKRKKNIQTIPALNISLDKSDPLYKEIKDYYGFAPWGASDSNTGAVSIYNSHPGNKQMLIHEVTHSSDRPDDKLGRLIPPNDQLTIQYRIPLNWKYSQYGKDMMKEYKEKGWRLDDEYMGEEEIPRDIYEQQQFNDWNKYLLSDQGTEVRARLSEIRQDAQEQNIYDPFNKKITRRQFKNLKNIKYPDSLDDLKKTFSDKDIKWMLNNISKNNNETEDAIQYGKKGGAKKKYTSDIINSTNYLFAEHPLFKKKKQSKKRIYNPNAKYYQLGGLTRFVPQAGRMFALPPITNTIANTAPGILNSIKTISQKLPTNLLDEGARDLLHYPSFDVTLGESNLTGVDAAKYLGDFGFKPYSEGWTALSDMKNAFEGKQWNPSKEDYYTLDEIYNLINKQTNYLNDLAKFNETNPDELGEYGNLLRWMQNDFSRDELFSLLFPNSSRPNFKEKFYRPEHINLLKQTTPNPETGINLYDNLIKNTNFGDKGLVDKYTLRRSITEPNTEILPGSEDLMLYRQRYEPYRGLDAGNLSERKDVIEFLKDHDGILGFEFKDLNNEYSNNLNYWKEQIFEKFDNRQYKKFQKKFKEQSKPGTSSKLKGLDAYNQIINRTGSRNKYGGELPKGKYGYSVGNLIRKQFGGLGRDQSLSVSPYDLDTYIGASGNQIYNPGYSLTYNKPNLFKKLDVVGTPFQVSIGRPYNTDPNSLTNQSLNFGTSYDYEYMDPGVQQGPQQEAINNAAAQYLGKDVQDLNQSDLNKFSAFKSLGEIKNAYAPGKPINLSTKLSFLGKAFSDQPVRGFGSISGGYNPEAGFWAGADLGGFGVISNKKPKTYFDRGLSRKGDWAVIPSLSLFSPAIRQKGIANLEQSAEYKRLLEKDIQEGTDSAQNYYDNQLDDQGKSTMTFNARPEIKAQLKPFKKFPGILEGVVGANIDFISGGKDSMDKITTNINPYGKISYAVSIQDELDRMKRKMKNVEFPDKKHYEDYVEEYENQTTEETPTETDNQINPPEVELNFDGQGVGKADCPKGYERPCEKCRCQKIKMPQMYTDKRGKQLFGNEPIRFQDGGEQDAMNAMMKARLAYANMFGNPSAQRMINLPDQPYEFDNGNTGTHYMASMDNYAVPQIQDENGVLQIGNYGPESTEAMRFDSDEDANYFAENYKDVSPGFMDLELDDNEIEEYRKGGYIIEDISVPSLTRMQPVGKYQDGGEYQLGDEVDEATMKQLKKLGFTFEQI